MNTLHVIKRKVLLLGLAHRYVVRELLSAPREANLEFAALANGLYHALDLLTLREDLQAQAEIWASAKPGRSVAMYGLDEMLLEPAQRHEVPRSILVSLQELLRGHVWGKGQGDPAGVPLAFLVAVHELATRIDEALGAPEEAE
jgi:hypothetical protein